VVASQFESGTRPLGVSLVKVLTYRGRAGASLDWVSPSWGTRRLGARTYHATVVARCVERVLRA
jgi:hypothetical protein